MAQESCVEKKEITVKWYFSTASLVTAFLVIGPFALPLVWFNPRFGGKKKTVITVIVILLSFLLGIIFANSLRSIGDYYKILDDVLKQ